MVSLIQINLFKTAVSKTLTAKLVMEQPTPEKYTRPSLELSVRPGMLLHHIIMVLVAWETTTSVVTLMERLERGAIPRTETKDGNYVMLGNV